jgi:hypothetical protein
MSSNNRHGQIGTGITGLFVILLAFLLMALFVALSAGALSILKPKGIIAANYVNPKLPVYYTPLFDIMPVSFFDANSETRKTYLMRVFDTYAHTSEKKLDTSSMEKGFLSFVTPDNPCLVLRRMELIDENFKDPISFEPTTGRYVYYFDSGARQLTSAENKDTELINKLYSYYHDGNAFQYATLHSSALNRDYTFIYYYGGCPK